MNLPTALLQQFPCAPVPLMVKGQVVYALNGQKIDGESDAFPLGPFNAISVSGSMLGKNVSADISVLAAPSPTSLFRPVVDPNGSKVGWDGSIIDAIVGSGFVKIRLANVAGVFGPGDGITVYLIGWIIPGPTSIQAVVQ